MSGFNPQETSMPKFVTKTDADRGFEFQVMDDAGEKIDWYITVVGADSDLFRSEQNKQKRRNALEINRTKSTVQSMMRAESDAIDLIVVATTGWRGKDAMAPYSPQEASRIYTEFSQIREQADRALNDRASFLPSAATSS